VALLTIDGDKVTYDKRDLPTGLFPYNVVVSPDGKIALTADNGNHGTSDGNAKSIGVIDLTADPVRVINHVTVGDSLEGLAISPKGTIALSIEARGSNQPTSSWFYHQAGCIRRRPSPSPCPWWDVSLAPAVKAILGLDAAEQQVLRAAGPGDEGFDAPYLHFRPPRMPGPSLDSAIELRSIAEPVPYPMRCGWREPGSVADRACARSESRPRGGLRISRENRAVRTVVSQGGPRDA
jgi:hypothetical protein